MSDFTSNFWSVYVTGISLVGIVACLLLLYFSGKGAKSLLATRLTWKSQSESYKDAVYGEKVALWKKGIRVA